MKRGKLNIALGLQWGSEGKGKLADWLAMNHDIQAVICDFQPNAGHTVVDGTNKWVFRQLPVASLKEDVQILIGPGATLDLEVILREIEEHGVQKRLVIHPNAAVVTQEAKDWEAKTLKKISSTLKGAGAALAMKVMRYGKTASQVPSLSPFIGDTNDHLYRWLKSGAYVLGEAAQGFDLSLNHGHMYPYTTGRDVTTASFLNNVGCPPNYLGDVYGSIRTYPIRVGDMVEGGKKIGTSGPYHPDQMEIDWDELKERSGANSDLTETTTVTGKVRRVFTISRGQLAKAVWMCAPTHIFINFVNHLDASCYKARTWSELPTGVKEEVESIHRMTSNDHRPELALLGTGPDRDDMVVLQD